MCLIKVHYQQEKRILGIKDGKHLLNFTLLHPVGVFYARKLLRRQHTSQNVLAFMRHRRRVSI